MPVARGVTCVEPIVAISAKLPAYAPIQVLPDRNAVPLCEAFSHLQASNFVVETIPGLNHLFQPAGNGHSAEYSTIETTINPVALKRISEWVRAITPPQ